MSLGPLRLSGRSRNRLLAAAAVAAAGGTALVIRNKRPQLPDPAPVPPRIGYTRGNAVSTSEGTNTDTRPQVSD
ncbi:hypothetical protein [Nocardia paucivorans]|uniref:hypothetical protein n=1 Tax=Nocardia paucivorans TaxID=114259 RepID=UPI000592BDDE|nr:hypothetical protein [Nocardia paucivorans]